MKAHAGAAMVVLAALLASSCGSTVSPPFPPDQSYPTPANSPTLSTSAPAIDGCTPVIAPASLAKLKETYFFVGTSDYPGGALCQSHDLTASAQGQLSCLGGDKTGLIATAEGCNPPRWICVPAGPDVDKLNQPQPWVCRPYRSS